MRLNNKLFLASLLLSASLTSYGVTSSAQSFANLNGNWRITGKQERNQYPLLSATLTVVGNRIIGAGWYDVICTTKMSERFDGNINFIGQIDSDGSFSLSSDFERSDHIVDSERCRFESDASGTCSLYGTFRVWATERYLLMSPERFRKSLNKLSPTRSRNKLRNDPRLMKFLASL